MIISDDPEIEGYEFRYKVVEVIGVRPEMESILGGANIPEHVFKGSDTREFRTLKGAEAYAEKLMRRGRGGRGDWPVIIQTGKLLWFTAFGVEAECARIDGYG